MTDHTRSYFGKSKVEPVTKSPRCFMCGDPPMGTCWANPKRGGRPLYACKAHQPDARAYWAEKFPEAAARLEAFEQGRISSIEPDPEVLACYAGGPYEHLRRGKPRPMKDVTPAEEPPKALPPPRKALPPPDPIQGSLL